MQKITYKYMTSGSGRGKIVPCYFVGYHKGGRYYRSAINDSSAFLRREAHGRGSKRATFVYDPGTVLHRVIQGR